MGNARHGSRRRGRLRYSRRRRRCDQRWRELQVLPGATGAQNFVAFNNKVLFTAAGELWVTDGTAAGTTAVPAPLWWTSSFYFVLGNTVLFEGWGPTTGYPTLWATDGTPAGTVDSGPAEGIPFVTPTAFGTKAVFVGFDAQQQRGVWITDGTIAGTIELVSGSFGGFTSVGARMLFAGTDAQGNEGVWITDGTVAGTSQLGAGGDSSPLGSPVLIQGSGNLWITDGTLAGTAKLQPLGAPNGGLQLTFFSVPFGDKLLFGASDAAGLNELWVTDGTTAGTHELQVAGAGPVYGLNSQ